jgi:uncharacterized protein (TIGR03663 family)
MKTATLIVCWISVVTLGAWLRFDQLSRRPFHADEATGAKITSLRMESGDYRFDPVHYHGPLLSGLAIPILKLRGESGWREMTKQSTRLLPATAGALLLLVPLLWRRRLGDGPVLLAAALLATSPLLVYYSRMFIHEMLLALFGLLALTSLARAPRGILPGLWVGLMFATKETFAISILSWTGAGMLLAWENRKSLTQATLMAAWQEYRVPAATSILTALAVSAFFYTDGFRQPSGAIDAIKTFFVYETVAGHDKPAGYYGKLLALPFTSAGFWWFGSTVTLLAACAYAFTFGKSHPFRAQIRFLAYSAVGHFLIYSLFSYKTPWLACLPWAHVCLLAGCAVAGLGLQRPAVRVALVTLTLATLASQFIQARRASGRLEADDRNPFAYVPTRRDVEALETWLDTLRQLHPPAALEPVAVIGSDYWPLPWYLRKFDAVGYWASPPETLTTMPLVFSMPEKNDPVSVLLADTHVAIPRGLRTGGPLHLYLRNDVWERWMNSQP